MPTFAVRTVHRSGWDPRRPMREQDAWDDHAAFMNGLAADGFVILGGPLGPGGQDNGGHGALLIVQAPDEQAVRTRLNADPWAARDILVIESVDPWAFSSTPRQRLGVLSGKVGDAAGGWVAAKGGVAAVVVVGVQPGARAAPRSVSVV